MTVLAVVKRTGKGRTERAGTRSEGSLGSEI